MKEMRICDLENDINLWNWLKIALNIKSIDLNKKLFDRSFRKIKWQVINKLNLLFQSKIWNNSMLNRSPHEWLIKAIDLSQKSEITEDWNEIKTIESHSCDFNDDLMVIANMNSLLIFDIINKTKKIFSYPWVMNIHSVVINNTWKKMLVTSSSFDALFEIDISNWNIIWEWFAWENGYNKSPLGHILTKNKNESDFLIQKSIKHIFIQDPEYYKTKWKRGLPTKQRALSINWADYFWEDKIWFTSLNYSKGFIMDIKTKKILTNINGLNLPHGFKKIWDDYVVCSTENWEILFYNKNMELKSKYLLDWIPIDIKSSLLLKFFRERINKFMLKEKWEWVEDCEYLWNWLFWILDTKRSLLILVNFSEWKYRKIDLPCNWALSKIKLINEKWFNILLKEKETLSY